MNKDIGLMVALRAYRVQQKALQRLTKSVYKAACRRGYKGGIADLELVLRAYSGKTPSELTKILTDETHPIHSLAPHEVKESGARRNGGARTDKAAPGRDLPRNRL